MEPIILTTHCREYEYPKKEPSLTKFLTFFLSNCIFLYFLMMKYCFYCLLNMLISIKITFNPQRERASDASSFCSVYDSLCVYDS